MVRKILKSKVMPLVSLLIGLLATVFILLILVLRTDFFAQNTSRMFSRYLFSGTPYSLKIDKIIGNPLNTITIKGLTIKYRGQDYSFDVLRIDEITCTYSIFELFRREPHVDGLVLNRPHLWIKPDSSGVNLLPSAGAKGKGGLPAVLIDHFAIYGGQIIVQGRGRADAVRNVSLSGSMRSSGREFYVGIEKGEAENLARSIHVRNLTGDFRLLMGGAQPGEGGAGSRLLFNKLGVELEETVLLVSGSIDPDSMRCNLRVQADPLNIEEMARAAGIETSHVGEIQGTMLVKGVPARMNVAGLLSGVFSGYGLSDLSIDVTVDSSGIEVERCRGGFNSAGIEGKGAYSFGQPTVLSLDLDVSGVDLSEGFVPGRNLPESEFNGNIKLEYRPSANRLQFSLDLDEGHFKGFPFEHAMVDGVYDSDSLRFDRIVLTHPSHSVSSHGELVGGESMRFFIDLACSRHDTLFSYFGIEEYRAALDVNGIIEGTFESWELRSSGLCSDYIYSGAYVPEGEIKFALIKDNGYRVFLDLHGDSCYFESVGFSNFSFALEYADGITNIKELQLSRPECSIETRAEISSREDYTAVDFGEVYIDAFDERWTGSGAFTVLFEDTMISFDDMQFHSRLGALYVDGAWRREDKNFECDVSFERLELAVANRAGILSQPVDGTARGSISLAGALSDPDLNIDLFVEHGSIDTIFVDSLRLNAAYSDGRFSLDSLAISAPSGRVSVTGDVSGLTLKDLRQRGGRALGGAVAELGIECDTLLLAPILSIPARGRFSGGSFSGTVSITDSLVHPNVHLKGRMEDFTLGSFRVPAADLLLNIDGNTIGLDGTIYVAPGHEGSFKGRIPLRPVKRLYRIDMDSPISVELTLEKGKFGNVTELTDLIAEAKGTFYTVFNITGTPRRPKILGEFNLSDAGFRLAGMEEKYENVNAIILLEDTMVVIKKLEGKEGRKGSFDCAGWISLKGWKPNRYHLEVDVDDVLVLSIPDILAIVSGTLVVDSKTDGDRTIPALTGSLVSKQAEIFYDIGDFSGAGEKGTLTPPSWTAAVEIKVPGNAWLKTPDASVELQGDIVLYHDQRGTYIRGELDLVRGWYNVYNNKFRVRSGKLAFVHAESFRPVVDIEAETRDPEGRRIYLFLAWHQDDVEPRLSLQHEDPGYSETDIWKMLGGGIVSSSNGQGTNWNALNTAQSLAANYIERMLNSQMEGVTIELERTGAGGSEGGSFEEGETMIAIGKYLSEGLYVKYKQGLSISTARQIEVEYRISNLFLLRSEIIRYSEKVLQGKSGRSSDEINVDFKLRWEF